MILEAIKPMQVKVIWAEVEPETGGNETQRLCVTISAVGCRAMIPGCVAIGASVSNSCPSPAHPLLSL